jgi:hypothetical protein
MVRGLRQWDLWVWSEHGGGTKVPKLYIGYCGGATLGVGAQVLGSTRL